MDAMQLTINNFRQLFPDKMFSLTFPLFLVLSRTFRWQQSNSDISRFSRQVVTVNKNLPTKFQRFSCVL